MKHFKTAKLEIETVYHEPNSNWENKSDKRAFYCYGFADGLLYSKKVSISEYFALQDYIDVLEENAVIPT